MTPNRENRLKKYLQTPEPLKSLYSANTTGELLLAIAKKYNVSESHYRQFSIVIGNVILGFHPKAELAKLLEDYADLTSEQASGIASDLKEFLAPVPENPADIAKITPDPVSTAPSSVIPPAVPPLTAALKVETSAGQAVPSREIPIATPPQLPSRYMKPLTDTPRYDERGQ